MVEATGRPARSRRLNVCRPRNHRLAQVLSTGVGLVLTGRGLGYEAIPESRARKGHRVTRVDFCYEFRAADDLRADRVAHRAVPVVVHVPSWSAGTVDRFVSVEFGCRTVSLDVRWVEEALKAGRPRAGFSDALV